MVVIFDNRTDFEFDGEQLDEIEEIITKTLLHQEVMVECEISFSFVTPLEIRELNRDYRQIDKTTDVLSFPMYENFIENLKVIKKENPFIPLLLGDIIISVEQAKIQGEEYGHSLNRELCYLSVHSVLHLLGYDHMEEEEKKVMRRVEKEIIGDF